MNRIIDFFWPGIPDDESEAGQEIRLRQFLNVAEAVPTISGVNLVNSVLTAFLFWQILPDQVLLPWLAIMVLMSGNRVWVAWRARKRPAPSRASRRTIIRSTIWSALGGSLWGAIALGMTLQDSILHHVFLAFVIGGQAISAAVWLSPILSASFAYIWLSVLPLIIGLAWQGSELTTVMAVMLSVFMLATFQLARGSHANFIKTITERLKADHLYNELGDSEDRLMMAIEAIDAGFALFDANDRLILANSRFRELYHLSAAAMHKGATFEDILRTGVKAGQHPEADEQPEKWIMSRISRHLNPQGSFEQRLPNNRWLHKSEYRTLDGGIVSVSTDISHLKQASESLKIALDQAESANMAKSEFLSSMSHELRTPLNAILGFAQLMQTDPEADHSTEQEESILQILSGGNHLLELINQILDLARIETGNIVVSIEDVLLQDVLDQSLPLAQTLARKNEINLIVSPVTENLMVLGDATRIRQVLLNLLSNAIKYNNPGGEVIVNCTPTGTGHLRVTVSDDGPGIPADKQDQVFEAFNRLGAEAGTKEGTGIGLTITRQLVELMNGQIGFDSTPGEGVTFWFEIPLAEEKQKEGSPEIPVKHITGRALYVEDNPANVRLMQAILAHRPGVELMISGTAEEGLELALSRKPDIIFMDIGLPEMDGYEATEILKSDPATQDIRIVAVSAYASPEDFARGQEAGFDTYVTKPVVTDNILAELDETLAAGSTTPVV